MILRRLHPDGRRLVTAELVSGSLARWPERAYADLLLDAGEAVDLEGLDAALDEAMHRFEPFDPAMDAALAEPVHRALPLSRRRASEAGLWRFLTVVHRPDAVRHRWAYRSLATMKSRFWSPGTRPDSNALARWWWIAELTRDGDDYGLTRRVLEGQPLAHSLFVRNLSWYRPVVAACADVLADAPRPIIEATMRRLTKTLSLVLLESRSRAQLAELVRELRHEVTLETV